MRAGIVSGTPGDDGASSALLTDKEDTRFVRANDRQPIRRGPKVRFVPA